MKKSEAKNLEKLAKAWCDATFDESELPEHEKTKVSDLATYRAMASLGYHSGYKARNEEVSKLRAKIKDLKAESAKEWSDWAEQVKELKQEIKDLKAELREVSCTRCGY